MQEFKDAEYLLKRNTRPRDVELILKDLADLEMAADTALRVSKWLQTQLCLVPLPSLVFSVTIFFPAHAFNVWIKNSFQEDYGCGILFGMATGNI